MADDLSESTVGNGTTQRTARSGAAGDESVIAPARVKNIVLPVPSAKNKPSLFSKIWFALAVVAPVTLGSIYFLFIAANQYVCEFRFSVREPAGLPTSISSTNPSGTFQGNPSVGSDPLDNFTVTDYIASQQAARDLNTRVDLRHMFSSHADPFSRFNPKQSGEKLSRYWRRMVYSNYDPASGLAVVRVRAFTPQDSYKIATTLVDLSKDLVNNIGKQSKLDSLRYAELEVNRSQQKVDQLRSALSNLRTTEHVIDPTSNSTVAGNAALATTLRASIAQIQTQISALNGALHNPNAPQIVKLKLSLEATRGQLAAVTADVTNGSQDQASLTSSVGKFESLKQQLQDATQIQQTNLANLQQVQSSSDAERLYITTYVRPSIPEGSTYPNRLESIGILVMASIMIWLIGLLLANSVLEHVG